MWTNRVCTCSGIELRILKSGVRKQETGNRYLLKYNRMYD